MWYVALIWWSPNWCRILFIFFLVMRSNVQFEGGLSKMELWEMHFHVSV